MSGRFNEASIKKLRKAGEILPCDVITEILSRLTPKSLKKLQLVRKDWKSIIHSPHFVEKHMNGSEIVHYFHTSEVSNDPPGRSDPGQFSTVYCRYGLLLLQSIDDKSYCLWNPAIHQLLQLPDPQKDSYGVVISYIAATRSFKLTSFYKDGDSGEACEVFVPGYSKAWKRLTPFPVIAQVTGDKRDQMISVVAAGEDVHCIRIVKVGTKTCGEVVSLDKETETFSVTSLPEGAYWDSIKVRALDWNRKLGFWDLAKENLQLMVLEDCKKHKWSENKKTIQLSFMKGENYSKEGSFMPLYAKDGDILFLMKFEEVYTYTMDTGKVTVKQKLRSQALPTNFFTYNPSMASFEGVHPDTKLDLVRKYTNFIF